MNEVIWKKFHNVEVSNTGLVKTPRHKSGYNGFDSINGYKRTKVTINNKFKNFYVHRLVGHLFLDLDINDNTQIMNHINCNASDNSVENLEIVSQRENLQKKKIHANGKLWGTTFSKSCKTKPYVAQIMDKNNKAIYLGMYKTERLAHMVAVANYIDAYGEAPHCNCDYCNKKKEGSI